MTWANQPQQKVSFQTRGRIGRPNKCGWAICGWSQCGDTSDFAGVYQMRYSDKGRKDGEKRRGRQYICLMQPAWPPQPPSVARDAQQEKFKTAFAMYQALTDSQKKYYNSIASKKSKRGYDLFMSITLKSL